MIQYPLYFHASAKGDKGRETPFEARVESYPPIMCAIPEGFNGPGGGYSPEDLYILAIETCFIATFKTFAEKAKLEYSHININGKLTVDRGEGGVPFLQKVDLDITLTGAQDQEMAKKVLGEAEKYCLVSNASKSEKNYNYTFA